jgi:type VI secretion system secreted protein Hcp
MTARRLFTCLLTPACVLALVLPQAAQAAPELFLELDGIPGESADERHADAIEVFSFSWGVGSAGDARPSFSSFTFTKRVDRASPQLLLRVAGGQVIPSAVFSVGDTANRQDFLEYCMTNVRVRDLSTAGSAGEAHPTESVSLDYGTLFQTYRRQNPDGSLSTPFTAGWDILRNTVLGAPGC